jgi:hypothetical protein
MIGRSWGVSNSNLRRLASIEFTNGSSQLDIRDRRLAQDVSDAPGSIEARALADLDFATVARQLVMVGI